MWCDDGAEPADDRDVSVVNGIFAAGLILHKQLNQIDNSKAAHHIEGALDQLDEALQEIRWAAFVRRRPGPDKRTRIRSSVQPVRAPTVAPIATAATIRRSREPNPANRRGQGDSATTGIITAEQPAPLRSRQPRTSPPPARTTASVRRAMSRPGREVRPSEPRETSRARRPPALEHGPFGPAERAAVTQWRVLRLALLRSHRWTWVTAAATGARGEPAR